MNRKITKVLRVPMTEDEALEFEQIKDFVQVKTDSKAARKVFDLYHRTAVLGFTNKKL